MPLLFNSEWRVCGVLFIYVFIEGIGENKKKA